MCTWMRDRQERAPLQPRPKITHRRRSRAAGNGPSGSGLGLKNTVAGLRLLRETSIGDRPQHPLQGDEAREDECGYSDEGNGAVNVTHDVHPSDAGSPPMILPIAYQGKPLGLVMLSW